MGNAVLPSQLGKPASALRWVRLQYLDKVLTDWTGRRAHVAGKVMEPGQAHVRRILNEEIHTNINEPGWKRFAQIWEPDVNT